MQYFYTILLLIYYFILKSQYRCFFKVFWQK